MLTITRKDLLLTINDNVIPAMGSRDVPVKFVNDTETYAGFLIEPRVGYYVNGCPKSGICEYDTSSNIIKIPAEAFKNKGILVIAIALIDNDDSNHIEVTKELALEVTPAPNGTVILPATDTWQTAVKNLVEQLYNQDYKPLYDEALEDINEAVQTANTASDNANLASQNVQTAYENLGDYKVENGVIYLKKADGSYNEQGITLAGQSSVLDGNGNVILSGNITPNDNLLTNSDYRYGVINQKGKLSYSASNQMTYTIDMWRIYNGKLSVVNGVDYNGWKYSNNTSTEHALEQLVDLQYDTYTLMVDLTDISGNCRIKLWGENDTLINEKTPVDGINILNGTGVIKKVQLCLANGSFVFKKAKLEEGQYYTGMPIWNNSEELTKCIAYFRILDLSFTGGLSNGTYMPRQRFLFENIMRKIPSVKHVSTETLYNCSVEIEYVDRFGITLKSIPTNKNDDWAILGYRVELDAYDY